MILFFIDKIIININYNKIYAKKLIEEFNK